MSGKNRCGLLKKIRQMIAKKNNIPYEPVECNHQGDCAGTCPKCDEEVAYLEQELEKRKSEGAPVEVAGVASHLVPPMPPSAKEPPMLMGYMLPPQEVEKQQERAIEFEKMLRQMQSMSPGVVAPPRKDPMEEYGNERKKQMQDSEGDQK